MRCSRLFLRIDMVVRKLTHIYVAPSNPLENFSTRDKDEHHVPWNPFLKTPKWHQLSLPLEGVWNLKNVYELTFGTIKRDWSVVWCSRLFLRIGMIVRKHANTHDVIPKPLENFSTQDKVEHYVPWNPFLKASCDALVCFYK